jgi:hypothetical protein
VAVGAAGAQGCNGTRSPHNKKYTYIYENMFLQPCQVVKQKRRKKEGGASHMRDLLQ